MHFFPQNLPLSQPRELPPHPQFLRTSPLQMYQYDQNAPTVVWEGFLVNNQKRPECRVICRQLVGPSIQMLL
jgi:hypothetical protein